MPQLLSTTAGLKRTFRGVKKTYLVAVITVMSHWWVVVLLVYCVPFYDGHKFIH